MSIGDELAAEFNSYPAAKEEQQHRPRLTFTGSGPGEWETGIIRGAVPADFSPLFAECLRAAGEDPDKIRLGKMTKQSHWQQRARNAEGEFETEWLHAFKFETLNYEVDTTDIEAVVERCAKKPPPETTGPYWFVFQASDQQIGKRSRDGSTEQIIEKYLDSVAAAKVEFKRLKKLGVEGIQISVPGDCIEGNQSQSGRNMWLTQEPVTEQVRIFRRLLMETVKELSPLVSKLYVDVVNGNHDQSYRQLNSYPGDGWATEAAIQVHDALQLNPTAFGHVEVRVPDKWSSHMTVPVGDSVVTLVHGHQWGRAGAQKWWSDQAIGNQPPAGAHILQNGHWHQFLVREVSDGRTQVQSSTFDCGSDWFRDSHGTTGKRGGLVYLLSGGSISNLTTV
jgi:hypothetical protein